jgi:hypothetical protein
MIALAQRDKETLFSFGEDGHGGVAGFHAASST